MNEPLCVVMTKVDSFTGETLPGVPFTLLDEAGKALQFTKQADGVYHYDPAGTAGFETGAEGTATLYYVPAGAYTLRETGDMGLGYAKPQDISITITRENGVRNPLAVRFQNNPTTLEFTKADAVTKEPLDGGVFRLLDESGEAVLLKELEPGSYRPDEEGQSTFTTQDGEAVFRYLPPQAYTIEELEAPAGYTKDTPQIRNRHGAKRCIKRSKAQYAGLRPDPNLR